MAVAEVVVEVVPEAVVGVVTDATVVAVGTAEVLLTVEYFVPRSNLFFCWTVFFFATGGAYAVNTGFVSFGLAPEST